MNKKIMTLMIGAALVGCDSGGSSNGDNGSNPTPSVSILGKAIDGYVNGATVFLDKNFNGVLDAGEPSAITAGLGDYDLKIDQDDVCAQNAPIIVHVPVGAIDVGDGSANNPVTKAYTMTLPPLAFQAQNSVNNVTPVTSKVWDQVSAKASMDGVSLTCAELNVSTETSVEWLETELAEAEQNVMTEMAITSEELYTDYIETDVLTSGGYMSSVAQDIVEDLQVVEEAKENADQTVRVFKVHSNSLSPEYRVPKNSGEYLVELEEKPLIADMRTLKEKVTSMTTDRLVYQSEYEVGQNDYFFYKSGLAFFDVDNTCQAKTISKDYSASGYTLTTIKGETGITSLENCTSFSTTEQILETVEMVDSVEKELSNSTYSSEVFGHPRLGYGDFIHDMSDYFAQLKVTLANDVAFDDTFTTAPVTWSRSYLDHVDSNPINVFNELVTYNSDGYWFKERSNNSTEYFCLNVKSNLNGEPFDSATSPLDYWDVEMDRNGDAVWIKVGNTMDDVLSHHLCDGY